MQFVPPPHKLAGPKHKVCQRILNVIWRQLDTQEIKEKNPSFLAKVPEQTIKDYLEQDLE